MTKKEKEKDKAIKHKITYGSVTAQQLLYVQGTFLK